MPRVAKQRSSVNRKPLSRKAGKPQNVAPKRLSALAQLVAIYAQALGITATAQLVTLTQYGRMAICKAKRELQAAERCSLGSTQGVHQGKHLIAASVHPAIHADAPLSPLKKKGLPHTPSKEKTTPLSPRLESEEPLSQTTTLSAAAKIDSTLPAIIQVGPVKLSVAAIDGHADLAGLEKKRARTLARTMAEDWVARDDVPNYPMSVIRRAFAQQAREDFAHRRDPQEWGAGRG